ncbi:MAG: MBL fold metallo-hydrolase [Candidatus Lokiarchaeota archaeon]
MEITWLGHASFKVKTNGKIIYFDPYQLSADEEKADIIVSTHEHHDHFDESSIKKILKNDTIVLGPNSIKNNLKKFDGKGLEFFDPYEVKGVKIELIPSYNIKKPNHPKEKKWAGVILESEGKKVYHAGDTERIPEMKDLKKRNIDVALLPCGGTYTMDFEESAQCAIDIQPNYVVPMHNWDKDLTSYKKIVQEKDPNIKVEILKNKTLNI